jgi:hypothetical protein
VLKNTLQLILRNIAGPPLCIDGAQLDVNVKMLVNLAVLAATAGLDPIRDQDNAYAKTRCADDLARLL